MSGIQDSIEFNSETCEERAATETDALNQAKTELEEKVRELEKKLLLQEKQDHKYNLLLYGIIAEAEEDTEDKLRTVFTDDLGLDYRRVNTMRFAYVHRIPSKSQGPKPIILRFTQDRDLVLSNAKKLTGSKTKNHC